MKTLVFFLLVALAQAKDFQPCEWARVLKDNGFDGLDGYSLANWVCLTKWESNYKTHATNRNSDGSTDYGIFQINSRYWCEDYKTPKAKNVCGIKCSQLLSDDVSIAIRCAKRVAQDPNGITAWYGWSNNCRGQNLSSYVAGCGL